MELNDLIDLIGREDYEDARQSAWRPAVGLGTSTAAELDEDTDSALYDVASDVMVAIWESSEMSLPEKMRITFAFYGDVPTYTAQWQLKMELAGDAENDDAMGTMSEFWRQMRELLGAEDALADPVSYVLFANWFEDGDTVEEAWLGMARTEQMTDRGVERLLESSGPVPYQLKSDLFARLTDIRWHPWILVSIIHSCTDSNGDVDSGVAMTDISELRLPPEMDPEVSALRHLLATETPDWSWPNRKPITPDPFADLIRVLQEPWGPYRSVP